MKFGCFPFAGRNRLVRLSRAFSLMLLLLAPFSALAQKPVQVPTRIVAVGDVHCDFDAFAALLQHNGLIDANLKWSGGDATLVQVGDELDRGTQCRQVMDLLMSLDKEAPKKRGRVLALLGNHEMMNITGDLRYSAPMFPSFADGQSESRRKRAWAAYADWLKSRAAAMKKPEPPITPEMQQAWMTAHPPGFLEQREAFASDNKYGRWLRSRPAVVRVGDTIFLHGGISPEVSAMSPEAIEQRIRGEMQAWDALIEFLTEQKIILPFFTLPEITQAVQEEMEYRQKQLAEKQEQAAASGKQYQPSEAEKKYNDLLQQFLNYPGWFSINPAGPLWYRGYANSTEEEGEAQVTKLLAAYGAARFVVGHTPQPDGRIAQRFGGKVFLIDTGMLSSWFKGGRASALEIAQNKISAVYMDSKIVLLDQAAQSQSVQPAKDNPTDEIPGGGVQQQTTPHAPAVPALAAPATHAPSASAAPAPHLWIGPDGNQLPFKSDDEVLEFLRTAKVLKEKTIGVGVTSPRQLLLEKDGKQSHAVYRDHDEEKDIAKMATGETEIGFRDSYIFECAAYELSRMLGINRVPPVVLRKYGGTHGSLQIWVEQTMMETKRLKEKIKPPDVKRWNLQLQILRIFDNLIYNTDRNAGNILIDKDWNIWFIDHTRAFRRFDTLNNPTAIVQCERGLWEHLQNFDDNEARQRLKPYLRATEIDALLKRRVKLVELIRNLIKENGEDKVLFSLS